MDQRFKQELVLVTYSGHSAFCKGTSAAQPRSAPVTRLLGVSS